ncbi:MAG TPA: 30S ribosomal protein S7 [Candidatus Omnitrophica bacterium]|nr:30S ribosomal protein S7 [Candidatus Omnitrophota bacterium]
MRRKTKKRSKSISKDPDVLISQFVNMIMWDGKKAKAKKIVEQALEVAAKKLNKGTKEIFSKAINNVKPTLEVKSRRVGGATYQVPVEVSSRRAISLAFRWIRDAARNKKGSPMRDRLASELIAAFNNEGAAVKKKEDTHKMAQANKAFSYYRW